MFYFYIIRSLKNGKLYLGYTPDDPIVRLKKHNRGEVKATKGYIPYELIYYSAFKNKQDAIEFEKDLKTTAGWRRTKKMLANTLKEEKNTSHVHAATFM